MVEEKLIWKEIWKNQEALITFLRGQDACHVSSEYLPTLKENCAFNNSSLNSKNKLNKKIKNFAFFKGYIYTRGIFAISTINDPK